MVHFFTKDPMETYIYLEVFLPISVQRVLVEYYLIFCYLLILVILVGMVGMVMLLGLSRIRLLLGCLGIYLPVVLKQVHTQS